MRSIVLPLLVCLISLAGRFAPGHAAEDFDVVIYGGTSGGVTAAIQTARMGKSVVLIEPTPYIGGLTTSGLGMTDSGDKRVIGGLSREFYQRVKKHYDQPSAWVHQKREQYSYYRPADDAMWTFEPHVATAILQQMLAEAKVPVRLKQRLNRESGVKLSDGRIESVTMESGATFAGSMFIDATYEGDLMAAAKVTYTVGREANATHGETLNGIQKTLNHHNHLFVVNVDPFVRKGDRSSGLLPGVHGDPPGEDGQADHRIQAYCFRMCMSNVPANRVPFPKPEGYDEQRYELLLRNFEAGDLRWPLAPGMMPNGKTDTNNNCAFSTDNIGMNYRWPEGSYAEREAIQKEHEVYQKGLMWTLANHPRVPQSIRERTSQWGLAADEFQETGNWPPQIYVREARRMVGDYVVTEHDCCRTRICPDPVGLGSYNMDSHNVQRYVTPEGFAQNEGDIQESPGGAYLISYRAIVPKRGEATNLLVPVCLSSSHIAYGSIRMEPVFMILGQSAATAAVLAIDHQQTVQDVSYAELRTRLVADRQVVDLPAGAVPKRTLNKQSLPGVVVDDSEAKLAGAWSTSSSLPHYVGTGYRHDSQEDQGRKSAEFKTVLKPGMYEVRFAWTANGNRSTLVKVTVSHAGGDTVVMLNQRKAPPIDGLFGSLGTYRFTDTGRVTVSNAGADGYVVIDAVQFLPQP